MKRIIIMVLKSLLELPMWFYRICKYGSSADNYTDQERYDYLKHIVHIVNRRGNVEVIGYGMEHLPKEDGFILFPNHQGMFDALAIIDTCAHPLRVVMKKEVENVILIKQVLKLLKGHAMDREDIRSSMKIIMSMTEEVKTGANYLIFPEGTRSREGNHILEFKGGTFKSAVNAKCPIVPVALIDSFRPFDSSSVGHEKVEVHYLEPIMPEQYEGMKTIQIAKMVHDRIEKTINQRLDTRCGIEK